MLGLRTIRRPCTGSFQMAVRTVSPRHAMSRGRPTFTLEACRQSVTYERKLLTPGEDQVTLRVRQHILHIPSKQDLKLRSQPAIKWTLRAHQRLEGLVRLLRVECHEHQVTVEQLHQPDLHPGDPHVP